MQRLPIKVCNYYYFILFSIVAVLINYIIFKPMNAYIVSIIDILSIYVLSCFLVKKIHFYEEYLSIYCPTRIFCRKYIIKYDNIKKVKLKISIYIIEWRIWVITPSIFYFITSSILKKNQIFDLLKSKKIVIKSNHPKYNTEEFL